MKMANRKSNWNLSLLQGIIVFVHGILCYNLDTKFPILYEGLPKDYFGYSVGLFRSKDGYKALITAPRANSTSNMPQLSALHQPGILLSCDISSSESSASCREVIVDTDGNSVYNSRTNYLPNYRSILDNMWLGVSLDIQRELEDNKVVVCGHLWKIEYWTNWNTNGACYVANSNLNARETEMLLPFTNLNRQVTLSQKALYAFAQAGTSTAFSEDGDYLLLGSPGAFDWCGTVASYKFERRGQGRYLTNPMIPQNLLCDDTFSKDYFGYSVTTGKFFGGATTYGAVGAPRGRNKKGMVHIFKPLDYNGGRFVVYQKIDGMQYGGYFGASVSGIDLNLDGMTDLLVGAPFYSETSGGDEGRVYVYISNGRGLQHFAELNGANIPEARFGTSIGDIGDLNIDGFNDVAIGAPYEDGKGAVYIYHGTRRGVNTRYAQRIRAAEINHPMISGFGISISRGLDIDNNSYPDLLIGSYRSSSALLFRTYPIVRVSAEIKFSPPKINRNVTACEYQGEKYPCVNVSLCLRYSGWNAPRKQRFGTTLNMDVEITGSPRGFLSNGMRSVSKNVDVGSGWVAHCFQKTAYIKKNIRDETTPVKFVWIYELDFSDKPDRKSRFCKDCPVLDAGSSTNVEGSIPFELDCGKDGICLADLSVDARVLGKEQGKALIIGQNDTLTLHVSLRNRGERSYGTKLIIHLPPEVTVVKRDFCLTERNKNELETNSITLKCDFGSALKKNQTVNLEVKIGISAIPVTTKSLAVRFEATTLSNDINPGDNHFTLSVDFEAVTDIGITGYQEDEQTYANETVSFSYKFYVTNFGPSPVEEVGISLHFPSAVCGADNWKNFLVFTSVEASGEEIANVPAKCNVRGERTRVPTLVNEVIASAPSSEVKNITSGRDTGIKCNVNTQEKANHIMNCETAKCETIHCFAGRFPAVQTFSRISVSVEVNLSVISAHMKAWNSIEFIAKGEISVSKMKTVPNGHSKETLVKTIIMRPGTLAPKSAEKWITFVGIGVGTLLLLIILAVLIKIGFFKRQAREKMKSMKIKPEEPNAIREEEITSQDEHEIFHS